MATFRFFKKEEDSVKLYWLSIGIVSFMLSFAYIIVNNLDKVIKKKVWLLNPPL